MKTIHRKVYLGIACGIFSLLTLFSSSASAWQGQGDGVARKCGQYMNSTPIGTTIDYFWNSGAACAWSGLGWVYYKYVDGYSGTLTFVPSSSGQGGFKTISADCPKEGGFWHYGYFQGKSWWSDPSHSSGSFTAYMNGYGTVGNPGHGWGHDHAYPQENDLNLNKVQGNLYHQIYRDGSLAAYAAEAWPADDVKALYDNYLQRYPGESNLWGNGLSAFCDFQDHTDSYPKATNYDAEITAQQGARNGDYIAVNISARVSRPSGADFEVSNYYSLINSYDDNANSNWTNISLGQSTNYITQTVWVEMPEESE